MDILEKIDREINNFFIKHAIKPTGIYLGHDEMFELKRTIKYLVLQNQTNSKNHEYMGIEIFEVNRENHIHIG